MVSIKLILFTIFALIVLTNACGPSGGYKHGSDQQLEVCRK